jgi:hypothetical protein
MSTLFQNNCPKQLLTVEGVTQIYLFQVFHLKNLNTPRKEKHEWLWFVSGTVQGVWLS